MRLTDNYELLVVDSAPAVELEGWRAVIPARGGKLGDATLRTASQADVFRSPASDLTLLEVAQTLLDMVATGIDARVAKYSPRYKLVFSLLNEDSSSAGALLEWDIQALLKRVLLSDCALLLVDPRASHSPPATSSHVPCTSALIRDRDPNPLLRPSVYRFG